MNVLITYSSKTGNTEKVARQVKKEADAHFKSGITFSKISDAPDPSDYDVIIIGFWIDKGAPNKEAELFMKGISGKKTAFFFTLGASPNSPHADKCIAESRAQLESQGNMLLGEYLCQGQIDMKLIEAFKSFPKDHPHAYSEESAKRYAVAASHPDEEDLGRAGEVFRDIFMRLQPLA